MNQAIQEPTYLFFDCETTGVKAEYNRIVQLAAILTDSSGKELERMNYIIYPDEFLITDDNAAIHGITHLRAVKEGVKLRVPLTHFLNLVARTSFLVAHNLAFDTGFISAELEREDMWKEANASGLYQKESYCTMETTRNFVGLGWNEKKKRFKRPRLLELHTKLFGTDFKGAHNAIIDVRATMACFFELHRSHGFFVAGNKESESGYSNRNQRNTEK